MSLLPEMALTSPLQRQSATIDCPRSMVGRVIGKGGDTIKALQKYTGALIQIDQSVEPTKVTISGTSDSLMLAMSMVIDIVKGTFKGFALLRQLINPVLPAGGAAPLAGRPVYAPGYGLVPPVQVVNGPGSAPAASNFLSSPSSSLDEQLFSVSGLPSPGKSLALQQVSMSMPQVTLPQMLKPTFSAGSQFALDSPPSNASLLRPAQASTFSAPAQRFMSNSASLYQQYAPSMMVDASNPALHGLFPGSAIGKLGVSTYHSTWPDAPHLALATGGAALSSLMGPASPTIGVNWDHLSDANAYYHAATAQVTN